MTRTSTELPWNLFQQHGYYRADPTNQGIELLRFCVDLTVLAVMIPGVGSLATTVEEWFDPSRDRIDDGRSVYPIVRGRFGFMEDQLACKWEVQSSTSGMPHSPTLAAQYRWALAKIAPGTLSLSYESEVDLVGATNRYEFIEVPGWSS
jgi:hypothetical protein